MQTLLIGCYRMRTVFILLYARDVLTSETREPMGLVMVLKAILPIGSPRLRIRTAAAAPATIVLQKRIRFIFIGNSKRLTCTNALDAGLSTTAIWTRCSIPLSWQGHSFLRDRKLVTRDAEL